jgi:hypothetical protein
MRYPLLPLIVLGGWLAGCADQAAIKPAEVLDERTGVTVGALQTPMEFVQTSKTASLSNSKRSSFVYLGPVEWDRMGEISYGLWLHLAPGNDKQAGDIRKRSAVTLNLDDGPLVLIPSDTVVQETGPYKPAVSWGQTSYYEFNVGMLKRMAASEKMTIDILAPDESKVLFLPSHDTHATLIDYMQTRGITDD